MLGTGFFQFNEEISNPGVELKTLSIVEALRIEVPQLTTVQIIIMMLIFSYY